MQKLVNIPRWIQNLGSDSFGAIRTLSRESIRSKKQCQQGENGGLGKMNELGEIDREKMEKAFWVNSVHESPQADSIHNMVNKMTDCGVFLSILSKYDDYFKNGRKVLELGGGQGWASCTLKRLYPHLFVTLTDISEHAIQSLFKWEHIFKVTVDNSYPCTTYATKETDASIDIVFCFAAAHHFTHWDKTMHELHRILKPNGHCFFFHEPTCSRMLHPFAYKRVNKKRPVVPEDVLIYKDLMKAAEKTGLNSSIDYNPSTLKRGPAEMAYYSVLSRFIFLQKLLPCTANIHLWKS